MSIELIFRSTNLIRTIIGNIIIFSSFILKNQTISHFLTIHSTLIKNICAGQALIILTPPTLGESSLEKWRPTTLLFIKLLGVRRIFAIISCFSSKTIMPLGLNIKGLITFKPRPILFYSPFFLEFYLLYLLYKHHTT